MKNNSLLKMKNNKKIILFYKEKQFSFLITRCCGKAKIKNRIHYEESNKSKSYDYFPSYIGFYQNMFSLYSKILLLLFHSGIELVKRNL